MSWDIAIKVVTDHFGISKEYLLDYNRDKSTSNARYICMALMFYHLDMTHGEIGKVLNRSRVTVTAGIYCFRGYVQFDKDLRSEFQKIENEFLEITKNETAE